ncbi:serine/arginine repetitive matrix protein 1-like [Telopea speciosissima]|uniref:serine/arginine repetitive matrix protein 1-like n=1 Tax=Telopea speciosissima TaxID=54955 RepID=UPI001CC35C5D|nr:serine/arginine repetitive matrix protein 1-like [Telopea speciosissima]
MEDAYYYGKSQRLVSDTGSLTPQTQPNPSKFNWHFLYKAVLVTVLLVILPLFPSEAPEFVNHSLLTRNWELFHLLFVGIAVSYGLFSRRNVETEKENPPKFDSAQNYVSRIFQVSSVFDDDVDSPSGYDDNSKVQTWNSRYFRGESRLVVEQESSVPDEQSSIVTRISNKPLLLPVRSLKSRVSESETLESTKESSVFSGSLSRSSSSSSSSNGSVKTRNGEIGAVDPLDLEERLQENVVLPSPIPWRSRSGRMEMKEEPEVVTPPPYSLPPSADEAVIEREGLHSRSFRLPMSPSPKKLSPSPSVSPELQAKNMEDSARKKSSSTSSPPPTPPSPQVSHTSPLIASNSSPVSNGYSSQNMGMKKSFKDELKDLRSSRRGVRRRSDPGLDTLRSEVKSGAITEGMSMAKSVRTFRMSEPIAEARKTREYNGERMEEKTGKRSKEVEAMFMETTGRRAGGFKQLPINNEKPGQESSRPIPKSPLSKYPMEEKKEFLDKVIVETDKESDGEAEVEADADTHEIQRSSDKEEAASDTVTDAVVDGEVDKKADEFIAKFREQIRLQRIASIKRANGKVSGRTSR